MCRGAGRIDHGKGVRKISGTGKYIYDRIGIALWLGLFAVTIALSLHAPNARSVIPAYRHGSEAFLALQPLYNLNTEMGYLYAPGFAALYVPFFKLGPYLGDVLWRLLCFGTVMLALVRQVRLIGGQDRVWLLSFGLFLAMAMSLGAVRNGQSTILLAGACWLLTLSALEGRRLEIFLWASLAILAKPTGIVMLLLVGALRPRQIPVLVLGILFVLAVPYLFAPKAYVDAQHADFFTMLTSMAVQPVGRFGLPADFSAAFAYLGMPVPLWLARPIRIAVAGVTLAVVLLLDRRVDARVAPLAIYLVAACYMCVFNPRVEPSTYAMVALPAGMALALFWREQGGGALRLVLAGLLVFAGLTGLEPHIQAFFHLWLRALVILVIVVVLTARWLRSAPSQQAREEEVGNA